MTMVKLGGTWSLVLVAGCAFDASGLPGGADGAVEAGPDAAADAAPATDADISCTPALVDGYRLPSVRTGNAITVDGVLAEGAWSAATSVTFEDPDRSDNVVRVYTVWNESWLYFAYEVADVHLVVAGEELWRDDGAEIYLDTAHDATQDMNDDDFHFITNIQDQVVGGTPSIATTQTQMGFVQELAIPWSSLSMAPRTGQVIGLLLGNNDRDDDGSVQFDWNRLIETGAYARPYLWGDLVLHGAPCR